MRMDTDFRKYYELENYIFDEVGPLWRRQWWLNSFDFFAILVWKSNRSKTKMRTRLLSRGHCSLEEAVHELTAVLPGQPDLRSALHYLMAQEEWGFQLPMASAVLTVLYPEDATVYDVRVCAELKRIDPSSDFERLSTLSRFDPIWEGYQSYIRAVSDAAPSELSLRDKDRWLWGRSFHRDLRKLVASGGGTEADHEGANPL